MAAAVVLSGGLAAAVGAMQAQPAELVPPSEARDSNLRTYVELMRSDIRRQKVALISETLLLTEAEDAVFWPIYRQYALELSKLYDARIQLIEAYVESFTTLTDAQADALVVKALDLESRRTALKQKYFSSSKPPSPRALR